MNAEEAHYKEDHPITRPDCQYDLETFDCLFCILSMTFRARESIRARVMVTFMWSEAIASVIWTRVKCTKPTGFLRLT